LSAGYILVIVPGTGRNKAIPCWGQQEDLLN
jgi:hypothetical protein